MNDLKLYVWHDVLTDWTSGVMFALAKDARQARRLILAQEDSPQVRRDLKAKPTVYKTPMGEVVWGGG